MFLAIGACYTNDIFREAAKRGIAVKSVQVDVEGDWGGDKWVTLNALVVLKESSLGKQH